MFGLFNVGSVVSVTANWVIACLSGELMSRAANDPSVMEGLLLVESAY